MRRRFRSACFGVTLIGIALAHAASGYEFTRVIDGGTMTPGVNVTFADVQPPVLDGDHLAFCGQSFSQFGKNGYYHVDLVTGDVTAIATDSTPSPSGGGNFRDLCITGGLLPSIDAGDLAFAAYSSTVQGVYLWDGSLGTVADEDTDFPGTDAMPFFWDSPSLGGRIAVTWGNTPAVPNFAGVYSFDLLGLFAVIDTNITAESAFFNVSSGTVNAAGSLIGHGAYVWHVNDSPSGPSHVYRRRFQPLGEIERIASSGQMLPDESFVLSPLNPQVDRSDPEQLCFVGGAPIGAVYRFDGAQIERVADLATPIPDGSGTFEGFGLWCSIDQGDVVFDGYGASFAWGVYRARSSGQLEKVVDATDALPGGAGSQFSVSREAISNGRIAFRARVGTEDSIFVTPEPGAPVAGVAVLALLAARQRLRPSGFASASRRAIKASTL